MKYRKLGDSDFNISIISAGLLGLDFVTGELSRECFGQQLEAARYAVENGVNALNLGFPFYLEEPEKYTESIKSFLAEEGVRGKVKLFINLPVTGEATIDDFESRLAKQQEWYGIDCFDYCLIEDIDRFGWVSLVRRGGLKWALEQKEKGRFDKLGFDFRDDCFFLKNIFDEFNWDVCQFRYSFMDSTLHPGFSGIEYVTDAKAGLVVTEPFKTRRLLKNVPAAAQELWDGARVKRGIDEWALLWIWNHGEISSTFTSFQDLDEAKRFMGYADNQEPIDMYAEITINKVIDVYKKKRVFGCTECRCCMPCKVDLDSPGIAALYNDYLMYENESVPRFLYRVRGFGNKECIGCGLCSKQCPRRYQLMDAVIKARELLG